jgi:tyrosyl-tRNA synthetase
MTTGDAHLYDDLAWRGLVYDSTEGLRERFAAEPITAYIGFDPTASSLHVGSLLPVMALARLQRAGHSPIAIVGGGTGMIGDPSGKSQERTLLTRDQIEENVAGLRAQLARFLDFDHPTHPARIVNNADWLAAFNLLDFLRDTGKYFTVNYILQKESVNRRLESEEGISFTEFSYLLLQARDFVELFDRFGCTLQLGGSDQWGNITAGIDLIRKLRGKKAHGLVMPLVTTAAGVKFGKTEAGTVWLDPSRTSAQEFRQFWLTTDDRDVIPYLKYFTFLSRDEIEALEAATTSAPEKRAAQAALADAIGQVVHGGESAERVASANATLFSVDLNVSPSEHAKLAETLASIADDVPSTRIAGVDFDGAGVSVVDIVTRVGLAASKSEARRLLQQGGVKINGGHARSERASGSRRGAERPRVSRAAGRTAAAHRAADLTSRNRYAILLERSARRNPARFSEVFPRRTSTRSSAGNTSINRLQVVEKSVDRDTGD